MSVKERIAIVPGSFDPITKGHLSIISKASQEYDKVFVAVMINPEKEYMFDIKQRTLIAKACLKNAKNVQVISSEGWLWELAKELGACAIVKGYRNDTDLKYEQEMASFNKNHYPDAETILVKSEHDLINVSSSLARLLINSKEKLNNILSDEAIETIKSILKSKSGE